MKYIPIALMCLICVACGNRATQTEPQQTKLTLIGSNDAAMMPNATVFKMSGDYADKVGVTLNSDGTLAYYPAPADISALSAPYRLDDGWWLNRQGISSKSVFTKWTFEEYANLPATPTQQEIIDAIIPGARVTEMVTLPIPANEALSHPSDCNKYLKK